MESIKTVAEFFLLSLATGMWVFTIFINPKETGSGYVRLASSVAAVSLTISAILNYWSKGIILPQFAINIVAIFLLVWGYINPREERGALGWGQYFLLSALLVLQCFLFHGDASTFLFFLTSTLLMGSIVFAMVLGHWYLVVPKLSEKPLLRLTQFSWLMLAIKLTLAGLFMSNHPEYFEFGASKGAGYSFNWMMLTMRVGWGYLVILVMSYFGYRLIKMRSIQSATGILYAMTFFILAGELVASYLFYAYGMKI